MIYPEIDNQTILDLGCGVRDHGVDFIDCGVWVIGDDINDEFLHEARSRCPNSARFMKAVFRNTMDLNEHRSLSKVFCCIG